MRTKRQLGLFGLFAAAGVGVAVSLGISTRPVECPRDSVSQDAAVVCAETHAEGDGVSKRPEASDSGQNGRELTARGRTSQDPRADRGLLAPDCLDGYSVTDNPSAERPIADNRLPAHITSAVLPDVDSPPGPMVVAPEAAYGRNEAVAAGEPTPAETLDAPPERTTIPPPPPEAPPAAGAPHMKSKVNADGDGKLHIRIYDEDIRRVLDLLSEVGKLNILASKSVVGNVSATLNGVDVESALGAILKSTGFVSRREGSFIFVGLPEDFNNIEQGMDRVATRVYRTNYVNAAELKSLVEPLLTEKIGKLSVSTAAEAGIASNDATAGGDKFSGNEVIIVRDFEAVLAQVDQVVEEVDVRPMQVAIDAMILSVQLKDEDKFGVNFQFLRDNPNIRFGLGSPAAALSDAAFPLSGGLKFGFLDANLGAFVEALETVGDTNVVANPRLMVLNKQRAEIQIGDKKGYINQTVTQTASSQSVEFLDIGTQLRLRPFISSDGVIRMEVHPELSDGDVQVVPGSGGSGSITLPNKTLTQVTTNIMVRDGCTVVIGGLIREQLQTSTTQVPVLGNLPFIGAAFRQTDQKIDRREVLVLITPRIVYEPGTCQEGSREKCEYLRRQDTYAEKMSPLGKRSIARRYHRLAETAYAEGDRHRALRLAEMAVQFDPLDRSHLELRSAIWLDKPYVPGGGPVSDGAVVPNPLEGQEMAGWLIDDLENAPAAVPAPLHPLDPGIPGRHRDLERPRVLQ